MEVIVRVQLRRISGREEFWLVWSDMADEPSVEYFDARLSFARANLAEGARMDLANACRVTGREPTHPDVLALLESWA